MFQFLGCWCWDGGSALENILYYQYYATLTKGNASNFMQNYTPFTKTLNRANIYYKVITYVFCLLFASLTLIKNTKFIQWVTKQRSRCNNINFTALALTALQEHVSCTDSQKSSTQIPLNRQCYAVLLQKHTWGSNCKQLHINIM